MQLKMFRVQRALFAISTVVLGSVSFNSLSFAATQDTSTLMHPVISIAAMAPVSAADAPIMELWQKQSALTASLESSGLIAHDSDDEHDHHTNQDGIGGDYDPDYVTPSRSDRISDTINQVVEQVQRRESGLQSLNQSVMTSPDSNIQLRDILAVEPVANARVTSPYGYRTMGGREFHPGVDLAVPYGTPIYATGSGVVVYSGWKNGYGNFIEIDHGNGYVTRYGHSSRLLVSVGDQIKKDQEIALVGCTGRCTGPHLHYEVLLDGKRQNPATYFALAPRREE
jgi:murein DD-endopeptidase MepM/ murein hydrolase activator NlpD